MCGISGIYHAFGDMREKGEIYRKALKEMNESIRHRGPDEEGIYLRSRCGLAHVRLSILDLKKGQQPMVYVHGGREYAIVYNGEIYNMNELQKLLKSRGVELSTNCDTEVILKGYALWGEEIAGMLNGIFAFAIWEEQEKKLILVRDPLGVKPLYYHKKDGQLIFASEMKSLLTYNPNLARCDKDGLRELLALGPAHTPGRTVYREIQEVKPGSICSIREGEWREYTYWELKGREHKENREQTIEKVSFLVEDAVKRQMLSDLPVCTFLSGGLDSSIVSAIAAAHKREQKDTLATYSFDFIGNEEHFLSNSFQPSQDAPYAREMAEYLGSRHQVLWCNSRQLFDNLLPAMRARDMPCMADVESSLFYFCEKVRESFKVTLTGECADEIFGGYPWFYKKELFETQGFPWSRDCTIRELLLKEELVEELKLSEYSRRAYEATIAKTPEFAGDNSEEKRRRELMYLNIRWFMATLLERMDRTSMHHGLEARVPFADIRIVEYLYNVPWHLKYMDGMEKGLLRHAARKWLPDSVLFRKKSPYPKTYDPGYEMLLRKAFEEILNSKEEPIHQLMDKKKASQLLRGNLSYTSCWYGQLMAGPQLLAYYLQINGWMKEYGVRL
ncbi:MAG: asparagine synthase (glutamine-hydrolyzing) [Lachnospiraceae bacterium]|nr:asparagine synthase (glutamine-hydrolyzing) [Lachnospiraceae bacterium]